MEKLFCCKEIKYFSEDPRDPIEYDPQFREYYIRLDNRPNIVAFAFCPWCGTKLPDSLREEHFNILEKEYGIDYGDLETRSKIPVEFQSDKWWKKRKL